jgi:5-methylcytosine-specific restriction endonuclease McrA
MKPYTELYFKYFAYDTSDFIPCEICGNPAVDIHHIKARGIGGTTRKETIENLMALCRVCHIKFGDKKEYYDFLDKIHSEKIKLYANRKN